MQFRPARSIPPILVLLATICLGPGTRAAGIDAAYRFVDTGSSSPSSYGKGSTPYGELLQASDGNFYGTTVYGGAGLCPRTGVGGTIGCGTVFRITPKGVETVLYSFPFDTGSNTAANGAFPTAGLIQGKDGYLYGTAQDGGIPFCGAGAYGCGTLFRVSLSGTFTLLHQFCGGISGCAEGAVPYNHLVQAADGTLYGATAQGGNFNDGTLFAATTAGAVTTLHYFAYGAGDGYDPIGALLIGHDGSTLFGTTRFGGANNAGAVFRYGAGTLTILHSFDGATASYPQGALIYGADGLLYGTTYGGDPGGTLFSLTETGGGFTFNASFPGGNPITGLVLGSDGLMYGTLLSSAVSSDGSTFVYNPSTKAMKSQVAFTMATGAAPRGALIEGKDKYLYGTNSLFGGSNSLGVDGGTLYRIAPALKQ